MEYRISHLYYTISAKKRGHGIFATSLSKDEEMEINKSLVIYYTPPTKDMPNQPSNEEIMELFPINKAFLRLKSSSKHALLCSRYTGRCNHTPNRFGNFLSHVAVFDESLLDVKLPVLLEEYPFRKSLTVVEEDTFEIDSVQWSFEISEQRIEDEISHAVDFLNMDENRKVVFAHILDEILCGRLDEDDQNIVIRAPKEVVKTFIYSLYNILPSCLINQFSFATYFGTLRNCPFKIVGIVPESVVNIKSNNLFFDLTVPHQYVTKNYITAFFITAITNSYIRDILDFGEEIRTDVDINVLNHISKRKMFYREVAHKTYDELMEVLELEKDESKQNELLCFVLRENLTLIDEYLKGYAQRELRYIYDLEEKLRTLNKVYEFVKNSDFQFYDYYLFFKELLSDEEKLNLSIEFLIKYVGQVNISPDEIDIELENANKWFADHDDDNRFNMLKTKYANKIRDFFHLNRIWVKKEFDETIKVLGFIQTLSLCENDLLEIDVQYRMSILVDGLLSETVIGKFDTEFNSYITLIEEYFGDDKYRFWVNLFDRTDLQLEKEKHSISWLRKQFVIATLNINELYVRAVAALLSYDEQKWLLEYYRERLPRENYSNICMILGYDEQDN
jgi:hypothetical protein